MVIIWRRLFENRSYVRVVKFFGCQNFLSAQMAENFNPVSIWAQLQKCLRIQEIVSKCHFWSLKLKISWNIKKSWKIFEKSRFWSFSLPRTEIHFSKLIQKALRWHSLSIVWFFELQNYLLLITKIIKISRKTKYANFITNLKS